MRKKCVRPSAIVEKVNKSGLYAVIISLIGLIISSITLYIYYSQVYVKSFDATLKVSGLQIPLTQSITKFDVKTNYFVFPVTARINNTGNTPITVLTTVAFPIDTDTKTENFSKGLYVDEEFVPLIIKPSEPHVYKSNIWINVDEFLEPQNIDKKIILWVLIIGHDDTYKVAKFPLTITFPSDTEAQIKTDISGTVKFITEDKNSMENKLRFTYRKRKVGL